MRLLPSVLLDAERGRLRQQLAARRCLLSFPFGRGSCRHSTLALRAALKRIRAVGCIAFLRLFELAQRVPRRLLFEHDVAQRLRLMLQQVNATQVLSID